ncbi:hypothetical protein Q8F55_001472 [Vanrija albida]|uniref:Uncharacterized protein n=1 Tax=Vanrija albida TaxID=181172 RepID=A0ABR3QGT1_9TREE
MFSRSYQAGRQTRHVRRRHSAPGRLLTSLTEGEASWNPTDPWDGTDEHGDPDLTPREGHVLVKLNIGRYYREGHLPSPMRDVRARVLANGHLMIRLPRTYSFNPPQLPPASRAPTPSSAVRAFVPLSIVANSVSPEPESLRWLHKRFTPLDDEYAGYIRQYVRHAPCELSSEFVRLETRAMIIQRSQHYARFVGDVVLRFHEHLEAEIDEHHAATVLAYRRFLLATTDSLLTGFIGSLERKAVGHLDGRRNDLEYSLSLLRLYHTRPRPAPNLTMPDQPQPHNPVGHKHEAHGHEHHHHAHPHHEHHDPNSHPQKTAEFQAENAAAHAKKDEPK